MKTKQIRFDDVRRNNINNCSHQLYIISADGTCRVGESKDTVTNRLTKYQSESPLNLKLSFIAQGPRDKILKVENKLHKALDKFRVNKDSYNSKKKGSWYKISLNKCVLITIEILNEMNLSVSASYNFDFIRNYEARPEIFNKIVNSCTKFFSINPKLEKLIFKNKSLSSDKNHGFILSLPKLNEEMYKKYKGEELYNFDNYSINTIKYIERNGFNHYVFSSHNKVNLKFKGLCESCVINKNESQIEIENILDIQNGICFQNFYEAYDYIQDKIINYQKNKKVDFFILD